MRMKNETKYNIDHPMPAFAGVIPKFNTKMGLSPPCGGNGENQKKGKIIINGGENPFYWTIILIFSIQRVFRELKK